jgi:hypothetical protein
VQYLKNNLPAIIASNHPNAFMDPIAFSYMVYPPRVRYMARGDAFKPGLISKILESIGIVPIFRMQDAGTEGVKKNNESYKVVYSLLKRNKKVMIFAEGICVQEKRLRPIKKGVPRLIFTAQQEIPDKDILVIPVCLNYSNPSQIGSTLFINVGEPFTVKYKMNEYQQNPNATMLQMMNELYNKMLPLTIHIENPKNDELFEKTRLVLDEVICYQRKLNPENLEHIFVVEKEISEVINNLSKNKPTLLENFSEVISSLYKMIKDYELDVLTILKSQNTSRLVLLFKAVSLSIVLIFYNIWYQLVRMIIALPYLLSRYLAKKSSASIEFYASFFLAYSTFIFLFYFLIMFFVLKKFVSPFLVLSGIIIVLSSIPLIHYYPLFRKKVFTLLKILKNKTFALHLSKNIQQIYKEYEAIQKFIVEK